VDGVKRIGVTGWRGRLGSELIRRGCIPLKCDVTDPAWIRDVLSAHKPDVVIHCAAKTDVDGCEDRPELATQVNTHGTRLLCEHFQGPIVYLSTDYVFDGREGPYIEDAAPNPLGVYGWSKLGGELALTKRDNPRDLIVRTTVLFDCYSENFVTAVARQLMLGASLTLPYDLIGSPTFVPHLADGVLAAVHHQVSGVVNLVGGRLMTRCEMGMYIARFLNLDGCVAPGSVSGGANRPRNAGLRVGKAHSLGLPIGDPLDGIRKVAAHALETLG
jgi:dTDP-4-dehydrorhamnose reductase